PATAVLFTLSLPDALPIFRLVVANDLVEDIHYRPAQATVLNHQLNLLDQSERQLVANIFNQSSLPTDERWAELPQPRQAAVLDADRKSTRLNSSHVKISYA